MCFTTSQKEKTCFHAIKTRSSESRKIRIFPNRLVNGFGRKMASFFLSFYLRQNRPEKCVSRYSRKEKRFLQTIKTRSLKSRKFVFFAKGLVHDFGLKLAIFPSVYFRQHRPGKCLSRYSRMKKTFFQIIKTTS